MIILSYFPGISEALQRREYYLVKMTQRVRYIVIYIDEDLNRFQYEI